MKTLITEIKIKLRGIEERHKHKRRITNIEKEFLLLKELVFEVPHFYIPWKILKILQLEALMSQDIIGF